MIGSAPFRGPFESLPEKRIGLFIDDLTIHRANFHGELWIRAEQSALFCTHRYVAAWDDPVWAALEHDQFFNLFGEFRDDLNSARGATNDANALALQLDRMIPGGGMRDRPLEILFPRNARPVRTIKLAERADHGIALVRRAALGGDGPCFRVFIPDRAGRLVIKFNIRAELIAVGDLFCIGLDFAALRIGTAPIDALCEAELVERNRDVTGDARIGVLRPGAADAVHLFDDRKCVTRLLQLDRGAKPAQTGPDNDDVLPRHDAFLQCLFLCQTG